MKLKPIVASLMVLGLSAPAFAATSAAANDSAQVQLDAMKAQMSKLEALINSQSAGGFQQPADWMNRISISGLVNVDAAYSNQLFVFGQADSNNPSDGNRSNLALNNANIFVDATVNDWTKAHISLQYSNGIEDNFNRDADLGNSFIAVDEAYVTIANFAQSPLFFRAGQEYIPFGQYQRYPMVMNPTQLLSQTNAVAGQFGFVTPVGVYGSVYAFKGVQQDVNADSSNRFPRVGSGGADVGYSYCEQNWGIKLDAGYLYNMADVDFITQGIQTGGGRGYTDRVGGLALSADGRFQQFDASLRYVGALTNFNANDASFDGSGAQPRAYGAEVGFSFPIVNSHDSRVALGYQRTKDAVAIGNVGLPESRWYGSYVVNVSKWVDVGLEVVRDSDYDTTDFGSTQRAESNGTGNSVTAAVLRLGVKFA